MDDANLLELKFLEFQEREQEWENAGEPTQVKGITNSREGIVCATQVEGIT